MKAVYTTSHGRVFRINQDPSTPCVMHQKAYGASAKVSNDPRTLVVKETFNVSTLDSPNTQSNREMYKNLLRYIKEHCVTHIDIIQNRYQVVVDYTTIYNGEKLGSATVTRDIKAVDGVIALGTAVNNEDVFRRGKLFKTDIEFTIQNTLPYGIMNPMPKQFLMQVNNIAIFQSFSPFKEDVHQSAYETPYGYNDMTVRENLQNMEVIYSTAGAGIKFQPIELPFTPRKVIVGIDFLLTNYLDVYDDSEIIHLLDENLDKKYDRDHKPIVPDDKHYPHHMMPQKDPHPWADGDDVPDRRTGYSAYYRRCNRRNIHALLVVENRLRGDKYIPEKMVHIRKVIRDIPDIHVGEYVLYEQEFLDRWPYGPRKHHHHHHGFSAAHISDVSDDIDEPIDDDPTGTDTTDPITDPDTGDTGYTGDDYSGYDDTTTGDDTYSDDIDTGEDSGEDSYTDPLGFLNGLGNNTSSNGSIEIPIEEV